MSSYVSSSGRLAAQCLRSPWLWLIAVAVIVCLLVWVFLSGFGVLGTHLWLFFLPQSLSLAWNKPLGTRITNEPLHLALFFFKLIYFCVFVWMCLSVQVGGCHRINMQFRGLSGVKGLQVSKSGNQARKQVFIPVEPSPQPRVLHLLPSSPLPLSHP